MTLLAVALFIVVALFGAPLFAVFGGAALFAFSQVDIEGSAVIIELSRMASTPLLVTIPLFTFAGYLLAEGGAPARMIALSRAIVGWLPAGLAVVALFTCALFTAFTGASGVTIIALGGLLYPILLKDRYPKKFSMGLVTSCGSMGLLLPPSLPIILYGLVSQTSIDDLFIAGIAPGFILVAVISAYAVFIARREKVVRQPFHIREVGRAALAASWELPIPVIVLGGIYGGFITVSEAAALSAAYIFLVEFLIYRDLSLRRDLPRIIRESMILVGGILMVLGVAMGFTNFLIDAQVPMQILEGMRGYIHSPLMFLLVLNIFLLIVGCLMDIFSAIIVVVPLIVPIAAEFNVNPIHLAIVFLTNLEIGYLTPPVGLNLFIASFRFKEPIVSLYRSALPFLLLLLLALALFTYFPALTLTPLQWLKHGGG